jgi:hypothetical protein
MCTGKSTAFKFIRLKGIFLFLLFLCVPVNVFALSLIPDTITAARNDSIVTLSEPAFSHDTIVTYTPPFSDDTIIATELTRLHSADSTLTSADSAFISFAGDDVLNKDSETFSPNPKSAYLIAAAFPGLGQIYNRQYWKLPLIYSGVVGFMYAITWNNKNYSDYRRAYFDLYNDRQKDPSGSNPAGWSQSWQDFLASSTDPATRFNTSFQDQLKTGKDFYRRYRDLSIILGIVFYFVCIADAYVDAQMFDFDVSPDLSFKAIPEIRPATMTHSLSIGVNVCMTF